MRMENRRKIVIIGSAYPLRGGGISTYNERLATAFLDNNDDVVIYSFKLQYPNFLFPGKTQFSKEPPPDKLNIKVAINSINPINWIIIGREIKKLKPDIVIIRFWIPFMGPCLGTIARIISKNKFSTIISITDNIIPHEPKILDKILTRYFIKSIHGFITMSKAVLSDLNRFDNRKPKRYCPHPLYDNFGDPIPKEKAKKILDLDKNFGYILFFGFIRDYKGLDLLLKAFGDKRLRKFPLKILVGGEFYTNPQPYYDLVKSQNIHDYVIFKSEFIPNTEVVNYFCAADIVVQPYKNATQSGITQVAYHFNKPMIVTNVGGLNEIVPDGKVGYVVDCEPEKISDAIIKFFEQNKEQEFINNVKIEKEKYSWLNMLDIIKELYNFIKK